MVIVWGPFPRSKTGSWTLLDAPRALLVWVDIIRRVKTQAPPGSGFNKGSMWSLPSSLPSLHAPGRRSAVLEKAPSWSSERQRACSPKPNCSHVPAPYDNIRSSPAVTVTLASSRGLRAVTLSLSLSLSLFFHQGFSLSLSP